MDRTGTYDKMSDSESESLEKDTSIVYKPKKILALKDIDPEERMNMVKAFVNAANTYRDGTYGAYRRYGTAVPRSYDAPQSTGHNSLVYTLRNSARARSSSVVHRSATTREADTAQTCATSG